MFITIGLLAARPERLAGQDVLLTARLYSSVHMDRDQIDIEILGLIDQQLICQPQTAA